MADFQEVKTKAHALLGVPPARSAAMAAGGSPTAFAAAADGAARTPPSSRFSPFRDDDLEEATELAAAFMRIAREAPGSRTDKFDAVADEASRQEKQRDPGLVRHALLLFMTHDPVGRAVPIPTLMRRSIAPSRATPPSAAAVGPGPTPPPVGFNLGGGSPPPENQIDWFREDPMCNEHHEHWHLVYPRRGVPQPDGSRSLRARHGELFFYMHRQMLARYDAERIAFSDVGPVQPLDNYRAPIPQGYDPGQLAVGDQTFVPRAAGTAVSDIPAGPGFPRPYTVLDHEWRRDRIFDAAHSGHLRKNDGSLQKLAGHAGTDLLGKTNENTIGSVSGANPWSYYGNHHGMGHLLIGAANPKGDGVIVGTGTAIRDPAFWRWHKHIDDINFAYQEAQEAHRFTDAPAVMFRKQANESDDLILCLARDIPGIDAADFDFGPRARHAFGDTPEPNENRNWSTTAAGNEIKFRFDGKQQTLKTTRDLLTEMRVGQFKLTNGQIYSYPYLYHEPFFYALRVENLASTRTQVTVRLFLAPAQPDQQDPSADARLNDRRVWIEMDKFTHTIGPRARAVIVRSDKDSSIIRRPAIVDPKEVADIDDIGERPPEAVFCECGWPYHLLLPRGTTAGMPFKLVAILTDGSRDAVPQPGKCGSMSFCGAAEDYPDQRPMGYPFDRPLALPVATMVAAHANMAMRSVTITCLRL